MTSPLNNTFISKEAILFKLQQSKLGKDPYLLEKGLINPWFTAIATKFAGLEPGTTELKQTSYVILAALLDRKQIMLPDSAIVGFSMHLSRILLENGLSKL